MANGAAIYTGNWYAAISADSGATFRYMDPNSVAGYQYGGFCCDQRVAYAASIDTFFWSLMYDTDTTGTSAIRIFAFSGRAGLLANAFRYFDVVNTSGLGQPSGTLLDYPALGISQSDLYLTTNVYDSYGNWSQSVIARWSLAAIAAGSYTYDVYLRADLFTFGIVGASGPIMYFASHYSTSQLAVLAWNEADSPLSLSGYLISHPTYSRLFSCPAPDWRDPCGFASDRVLGGWVGRGTSSGILGVFWNAGYGSDGNGSHPYPYSDVVRINSSSMTALDSPYLWASSAAVLYPSIAVNTTGDLGGVVAMLGGSYYTVAAFVLWDAISGGWTVVASQIGNSSPSINRWGDFLTATICNPGSNAWVAGGFVDVSSYGVVTGRPSLVVFGRNFNDPFAPSQLRSFAIAGRAGSTTVWRAAAFTGNSYSASDYAATVDWGDGSVAAGTVSASGNSMQVTGSHAYASAGNYTVTTTVTDGFNAVSTTGAAAMVSAPSPVLSVSASSGDSGVLVTWVAPTSDGNSTLLGYRVHGTWGSQLMLCPCSALNMTLTGLANGSPYSFSVDSWNSVGYGPDSSIAYATPGPRPSAPASGPAAPAPRISPYSTSEHPPVLR